MYLSRVAALLVLLLSNAAIAEPNWGKLLVDVLGTTIENSAKKQETGDSATNNPQTNGGASVSSAPTSYGKDFPSVSNSELFAESSLDLRYSPSAGDDLVIQKVVFGGEVSRDAWRKIINAAFAGGKLREYYDAYHATKDTFKKEAVLDEYIKNFAIPRANIIKDKISRNEPFVLDALTSGQEGCYIEQWDVHKKAFPIRCTLMANVGLNRSAFGGARRLYINQKDYRGFTNFKDSETDMAVENALSHRSQFKQTVDMYVVVPQSVKFKEESQSIPLEPIYYRFTFFEIGKDIVTTTALSASKDVDKLTDSIKFHCPQCRKYLLNK